MGGGKSSSSASTTSTSQDNRVVSDAGGIAAGAGATLHYTYTQGLDKTAAELVKDVLGLAADVVSGSGKAVDKALLTTQSVAERNQTDAASNGIVDVLKSPSIVIAAAVAGAVFFMTRG